jgi:hypothetical protein
MFERTIPSGSVMTKCHCAVSELQHQLQLILSYLMSSNSFNKHSFGKVMTKFLCVAHLH